MATTKSQAALTLILLTAGIVAGVSGQSAVTTTTTATTTTAAASQPGEVELATQPSVVVNEDELAGGEESRAAAKKEASGAGELASTTSGAADEQQQQQQQQQRVVSEMLGQLAGRAGDSAPKLLQQAGLSADSLPVSVSPNAAKSLSALAAQLPNSVQANYEQLARTQTAATATANASDASIESLLPKGTSLFNRDSVDASQLAELDCHLRNVDYCLAGLMGSAQKMLPETGDELEVRCDEMKATTSCMAVYNKRCGTFKIFALLAPFSQARGGGGGEAEKLAQEQRRLVGELGGEIALTQAMEAQLMGKNASGAEPAASARLTMANLMEVCEPAARSSAANRALRQRLFAVAKCINARVPKLTPCLEDLKTAVQVFYEPKRVLPMRPTCCAIARFRACSMGALDNVCGLSSFQQLTESMTGGSGGAPSNPFSMLKAIERVCRQATDHKSAYCAEVLPPSGMRAPLRRGHRASKLAKALDLFAFAPAAQEQVGLA